MSNYILTVDDFCLSYKNRNILENLSFSVERGDYLAIGGVPGSGKSTLIKSVLGLINNGISGNICLLYTSPSPRDGLLSRMPSSA